jgi:hypothetical protein
MADILLFKVLVDGKPCHGGQDDYPPAGTWTSTVDELTCCVSGWHLTSDPLAWWTPKAELWLAEPQLPLHGDTSDKAAFAAVRLVERITRDWPYLPLFPRVRCFLAASLRSVDPAADIGWAQLAGANLSRANLPGVNLVGANLASANLAWASLPSANLSGAHLTWANLASANLARANLSGANMGSANLAWANLTSAHLTEANLSGANLSGANLAWAGLSKAKSERALYLKEANDGKA